MFIHMQFNVIVKNDEDEDLVVAEIELGGYTKLSVHITSKKVSMWKDAWNMYEMIWICAWTRFSGFRECQAKEKFVEFKMS